jgi:hypothetical protein
VTNGMLLRPPRLAGPRRSLHRRPGRLGTSENAGGAVRSALPSEGWSRGGIRIYREDRGRKDDALARKCIPSTRPFIESHTGQTEVWPQPDILGDHREGLRLVGECSELESMLREGQAIFRRVKPPGSLSESAATMGEVEYWQDRVALLLEGHPSALVRFMSDVPPLPALWPAVVYEEDVGHRLDHRLEMLARIIRECRRGWTRGSWLRRGR